MKDCQEEVVPPVQELKLELRMRVDFVVRVERPLQSAFDVFSAFIIHETLDFEAGFDDRPRQERKLLPRDVLLRKRRAGFDAG